MKKFLLSCALLLPSFVYGNDFVVFDGVQLCSWYQDSNSCYSRTIELITSYAGVGKIGVNNKSCDMADGSRFIFSSSMDGLLDTSSSAKIDWNFSLKSASGNLLYEVKKQFTSDNSFRVQGINKNGKGLLATFNEVKSEDTDIAYTARCNNYDSKGDIEYIITWAAFSPKRVA